MVDDVTPITKREAADILGCDPSTVNRFVSSGQLVPCQTVKHGARVTMYLFDRQAVERLAADRSSGMNHTEKNPPDAIGPAAAEFNMEPMIVRSIDNGYQPAIRFQLCVADGSEFRFHISDANSLPAVVNQLIDNLQTCVDEAVVLSMTVRDGN